MEKRKMGTFFIPNGLSTGDEEADRLIVEAESASDHDDDMSEWEEGAEDDHEECVGPCVTLLSEEKGPCLICGALP